MGLVDMSVKNVLLNRVWLTQSSALEIQKHIYTNIYVCECVCLRAVSRDIGPALKEFLMTKSTSCIKNTTS